MTADRKPGQAITVSKYDSSSTEGSLELPSYLYREGRHLKFKQENVIEGGAGEYTIVWDFEGSKDSLRQEVPEKERITANTGGSITFLGFEDPEIRSSMEALTRLANDPGKTFDNSDHREEYRGYLAEVYRRLAAEVKNRLNGERALFFTPKNGGIYVRDIFTEEGIPSSDFYDYRMSRVLVTDETGQNHLNVAAKFGPENPEICDYETFVFGDDCIASDISSTATLEFISSKLKEKGVEGVLREVSCLSPGEPLFNMIVEKFNCMCFSLLPRC